jgi:hypothetical protein
LKWMGDMQQSRTLACNLQIACARSRISCFKAWEEVCWSSPSTESDESSSSSSIMTSTSEIWGEGSMRELDTMVVPKTVRNV